MIGKEPRKDDPHPSLDDCIVDDALVAVWADVVKQVEDRALGFGASTVTTNGVPYTSEDRLTWLSTGIPEGERDAALYHFARQLRKKDVPKELAYEIVRAIRDARTDRPGDFPDSIIRAKVASAYRDHEVNPSEYLIDYEPLSKKIENFLSWADDKIAGKIPDGYRWGVSTIDDAMLLDIGHCYGVTAQTGQGKSWLNIQVVNNALEDGAPCLLISPELPYRDVIRRLVAHRTGIDSRKIISASHRDLLEDHVRAIGKLPLRIQCDSAPTIPYVKAHAEHWRSEFPGLGGLLTIDYMGLLCNERGQAGQFADQDNTANALADIAKQLDIAVLILFQQNKYSFKTREDGGGVSLANVFGGGGQTHRISGLITMERTQGGANDANVVMKMRVAKNRDGGQPVVTVAVDLRCGWFVDVRDKRPSLSDSDEFY